MSNKCPICGDTLQKNSPTSYDTTWSEIKQAWICKPCGKVETDQINRGVIDTELDRHSPLVSVIRCMQTAIKNLSDNEYIYQDDAGDTNIHHEEVDVIINLLSHSEASAIDITDSEVFDAYMTMFDDGAVLITTEEMK